MGLNETKKLLYSKGNCHQTYETAHRMGENLCHLYTTQGMNNQNFHGGHKIKLPNK
jgi:hypothetical protein